MNAEYRNHLPQLTGKPFLTDGGLETTLVFHDGFDLPLFAAFPLLRDVRGKAALDRYMRRYAEIAISHGKGLVLDTPTWRASSRWAAELGYSQEALKDVHRDAVSALMELRKELQTLATPMVINGAIGPQDDGYNPETFMSADAAADYHGPQIEWFSEFGADMVSAITMTYVEEAQGIARAAKAAGMPCVVSFTVETDGRLPSGDGLRSAIEAVDRDTDGSPAYFMINCAHPDHFASVVNEPGEWRQRIMGLRANASRMSHEELDNADELDEGNPSELGQQYRALRDALPNLAVLGGCCGTDHRHVEAISRNCRHHA